MQIVTKQISDLIPADYNPRKDLKPSDKEYKKLKKSIEQFGYIEPVVWNRQTGRVVGGHQRLKILQELGMEGIETIVVDLPEDKEKALNLALNKISGDWDMPKLKDLLEELDTGDFDIEITGFDETEIESLMTQFHTEKETVEDEIPDMPDKQITLPGDLWLLGKHRLLCGDATSATDVKRLMNETMADSMVTDPPYGVDYAGKNEFLNKYDKGNRLQSEIINDNITDYKLFFTKFLSIVPLADYNTVYIFMSGKELHSLRLAIGDCGYTWGDYLVWVKNNHVLGRKDYNSRHEFIVYGWKGRHKFYSSFATTVLEFDKPNRNDLHPTMKPVKLVAKLISDGTPQKGLIYDPFGGSGTTLIACEQLDRTCYMMELAPIYCDVIIKRWEALTGKKAVKENSSE